MSQPTNQAIHIHNNTRNRENQQPQFEQWGEP